MFSTGSSEWWRCIVIFFFTIDFVKIEIFNSGEYRNISIGRTSSILHSSSKLLSPNSIGNSILEYWTNPHKF